MPVQKVVMIGCICICYKLQDGAIILNHSSQYMTNTVIHTWDSDGGTYVHLRGRDINANSITFS